MIHTLEEVAEADLQEATVLEILIREEKYGQKPL